MPSQKGKKYGPISTAGERRAALFLADALGYPDHAVARIIGRSAMQVRTWRRRLGITGHRRQESPSDRHRITQWLSAYLAGVAALRAEHTEEAA